MSEKRRELLKKNRHIKRKIGNYVIRLREEDLEFKRLIQKTKNLEGEIKILAKKLVMEELRIKEDIDKLIGILNHCYDEEGL